MNFKNFVSSSLGKSVAQISRIRGGHGSALPGLLIEKIDPNFLARILKTLPRGVAVISGTNGKTTTAKMVVEILEKNGLKVFANESGSNFSRGVASSAISKMRRGKLNFDVAVLELDEAHAVKFVREIPPNFSLLLNVLRDQLDRFGEIDTTAKMLENIAKNTRAKLVLNLKDPRISAFSNDEKIAKIPVFWFDFSENLREFFPNDEELHADFSRDEFGKKSAKIDEKIDEISQKNLTKNESISREKNQKNAENFAKKINKNSQNFDEKITLTNFENDVATYEFRGQKIAKKLLAGGAHNALNGAAALQFSRAILEEKNSEKKFDFAKNIEILSRVKPAFGRGENFNFAGQKIALNLVKNPAGFRSVLNSANREIPTAIFINDFYADGRDVSWLFDVDFAKFQGNSRVFVGGIRAFDMALRLEFDDVKCAKIHEKIDVILNDFLRNNLTKFSRENDENELEKFAKIRQEFSVKNPPNSKISDEEFQQNLRENYLKKTKILQKNSKQNARKTDENILQNLFENDERNDKKFDEKIAKNIQNFDENFAKNFDKKNPDLQIFATYTAMLEIRKILKKKLKEIERNFAEKSPKKSYKKSIKISEKKL